MNETKEFINVIFDRIEKMISNKTIFGDPIKINNITIIPILKMDFNFGTGNVEKLENQKDILGNGFFGNIQLNSIAFLVINNSKIKILSTTYNNTEFVFNKISDLINEIKTNSNKETINNYDE